MMIALSDTRWIAVDQVVEININPGSNTATIRTKDGVGHSIGPGRGPSIYARIAELVEQLNGVENKA